MEDKIIQSGFSGSVLLMRRGVPLLKKAYGYAIKENQTPNTTSTTYRIASLSKAITAYLILRLHEHNLLHPKDRLEKFFPVECERIPTWKEINIEMLINHTSGICNLHDFITLVESPILSSYQSLDHLVKIIAKQPLLFAPGEKFHYSNPGYILLAAVVERVCHTSFEEALQTYVLTPLSLSNTKSPSSSEADLPEAVGYFADQRPAYPFNASLRIGAGNLISNLDDMETWVRKMTNPRYLPYPLIKSFLTSHGKKSHKSPSDQIYYSYGWHHKMIEGRFALLHAGNMHGCRTLILTFPKEDAGVILLGNQDLPSAHNQEIVTLGTTLASQLI